MKLLSCLLAFMVSFCTSAQQFTLHGGLTDTTASPIPNAAISLLNPEDSTMRYFGISNATGQFEIRSVKEGNYLVQVANMGYQILYKRIQVPVKDNDLGYLLLQSRSRKLSGVEIRADRVPVMLKGDTVEYNAGSYPVKKDAVVEDLLQKLPGVQVDKAGNIKAQGRDVKKVLVDGKDFFGDDPKMATKNLPADAIDKVQVFGRKSDGAEFTGIDDGDRDQTINLQLKESKRKGYFGDEEVGAGTDGRYKLSGKLYRFKPSQQFSLLGMLNDINQFGFTFQDYLSFQGGLQNLMNGGGLGQEQRKNELPLNYGQPIPGLITSGAAGVNYSSNTGIANRFSVSYLGNGADKNLIEESNTKNYISGSVFNTEENNDQHTRDVAHRLNFNWRQNLDSTQQVVLKGAATFTKNHSQSTLYSYSSANDSIRNSLNSEVRNSGDGLDANLSASYMKKFHRTTWPVWKLNASGTLENENAKTEWNNRSNFSPDTNTVTDHQYQDNTFRHYSLEGGTSIVRRLAAGYYLEPSIQTGTDRDALHRQQGILPAANETDSLSPDFNRTWTWVRPGLSFRHNTQKTQFNIGLTALSASLSTDLKGMDQPIAHYQFLLPALYYQNQYKTGRQFSVFYGTTITPASAVQLLPVVNYLNPLQTQSGNIGLVPEYRHTVQAQWMRFDLFSGTSLMVHLRGVYTNEKISLSRQIMPDLSERDRYVNVPDDYSLSIGASYSCPIRPLGLNLSLDLDEQINQGQSLVNEQTNINTTYSHNLQLRLSNHRSKKWDIEFGGGLNVSDARSSIELGGNATFYHYNGYGKLSFKPTESFRISLDASYDEYAGSGFPNEVQVPLLSAAASWYFLKNKRGIFSLDGFDLLNRNTSVVRISQLNFLMERRSNIIQQYFLLSFKYRLSKAGGAKGPVSINVNREL